VSTIGRLVAEIEPESMVCPNTEDFLLKAQIRRAYSNSTGSTLNRQGSIRSVPPVGTFKLNASETIDADGFDTLSMPSSVFHVC
jgi:hypothetical protein